MKKLLFSVVTLLLTSVTLQAQVGIGTQTPEGALDVVSTNSGVVLPRVANTAAVTTPVNGTIVYDLSEHCIRIYSNSAWTGCIETSPPPPELVPVYCASNATTVVEVPGSGGATWMDRNLGATQVAGSNTDADAIGDLYQWGRFTDGHQCISSTTTSTLSTTDVPDVPTSFIESSTDWRSTPNDDLWQGVNGTNNPCPDGFRVPTAAEWTTEHSNWMTQDPEGAFDSPLKLPLTGFRHGGNGSYISPSFFPQGSYWSSTVNATTNNAFYLYFQLGASGVALSVIEGEKANGYAVRCIKD